MASNQESPTKPQFVITGTINARELPFYSQASALYRDGDLVQAEKLCTQIIGNQPDHFDALLLAGIIAYKTHRAEGALTLFNQAIKVNPKNARAFFNRGNTQRLLKNLQQGLADYDAAIRLEPTMAEAYNNRGAIYQDLNQNQLALACYHEAIALNPQFTDAIFNCGLINTRLKKYQDALANYDAVYELNPNYPKLYAKRHFIKMLLCDWDGLPSTADLTAEIERNATTIQPFPLLAMTSSLSLQKRVAEHYAQLNYPSKDTLPDFNQRSRRKKIRVGYFSADFREHAVSYLTAGLFENHNRSRFELIAFSFSTHKTDAMRQRLMLAFDSFIDVQNHSDEAVAMLARNLEIDIAVDLGGYTKDCRTGIFALRAAPIQVNYLGYLGTMGVRYMDYLIADPVIIPEYSKPYYTEKIVYLPSYQPNDAQRIIADKTFTRLELGLPEQGFVFCCFNNNYKFSPQTFDGWMRILLCVKGSNLLLYSENEAAVINLRKEAQKRHVEPERLVFGQHLPRAEYLARLRRADLFLDTFPYNAGTTASDALWAGLPVLTYAGESFASRVAASLLTAIRLPELITSTQEQYEALAIELATDPEKLRAIKEKLIRNQRTTPLFDLELFTKNIESAYSAIYELHLAGLPPDHIRVHNPKTQIFNAF